MNNETTADGWGAKFLSEFESQNNEWDADLAKAENAISRNGIIIIIGKRDAGKTRIAAEISRAGNFPGDIFPKGIKGKSKTSVYRRATEIFVDLKDSFRSSEAKSEGEVIRYLSSAGLLVIDEFQERSESKWENRIITTIIDRRYSDNLPTILIANIELAEMGAKISDSIISRVNESGGVIECKPKNFRTNQK